MAETESQSGRSALISVSLVALFAGYLLGLSGILSRGPDELPEVRVGKVLAAQDPQLSEGKWSDLKADVREVRKGLEPDAASVFDLVVELRGLSSSGTTDWGKAEALCEGLHWTRCKRDALEELKRRSRP